MKQSKKNKLIKAGWRVGTVADFLQLSPEESAIIEIKLALSQNLYECRVAAMTQLELAQPPKILARSLRKRSNFS